MKQIWYVNDGKGGFHWVEHVFETKMEAERYARECFPDETEDERYARIFYKEVVSYEEKEVSDEARQANQSLYRVR